jgi:hypothetical protein
MSISPLQAEWACVKFVLLFQIYFTTGIVLLLSPNVAEDSLRWLSMQVRWVPRRTAPGANGNGIGHEALWAQAMYGVDILRMKKNCGHGQEDGDSVQARTSKGCGDGRAQTER